VQTRGGSGVISIKTSERNGQVIGAIQTADTDEMMLISNKGTLVRARAADVSVIGRNTQGVTLIKVGKYEKIVSIAKIVDNDNDPVVDDESVTIDDGLNQSD